LFVRALVCVLAIAIASTARPELLRVGPERELAQPSDAARRARDGDIIEIDAGVYAGDAAVWRQHNLTIRGSRGRAHLRADGAHAESKAIWVIKSWSRGVAGGSGGGRYLWKNSEGLVPATSGYVWREKPGTKICSRRLSWRRSVAFH